MNISKLTFTKTVTYETVLYNLTNKKCVILRDEKNQFFVLGRNEFTRYTIKSKNIVLGENYVQYVSK